MKNVRSLEYYLALPYTTVIEEWDDGDGPYFVARILELPFCSIHGNTQKEALIELEGVKKDWIQSCFERNIPFPEKPKGKYSGKYHLRLSPYLHRELDIKAKLEGVSLNQYMNTVLASSTQVR